MFDGAQSASFRLFSEIGTYIDVHLYPTNPPNNTVLSAPFSLSKFAKKGFWIPDQIVLMDSVGNQRFAGTNDFGWRLHIDNPLEDVGPPSYVAGSLNMSAATDVFEDHPVTWVTSSWLLVEDSGMKQHGGVYVRLVDDLENADSTTVGLQEYGYPGVVPAGGCGASVSEGHCYRASITMLFTEFRASANYSASTVKMYDVAENVASVKFSIDGGDQVPVWTPVLTSNVDDEAPELDVDGITISAHPTNPSAPNGETEVSIIYSARDNKSGVGRVSYRLLDPQGNSFFQYHYHENFYTTFFVGDPSEWATYAIEVMCLALLLLISLFKLPPMSFIRCPFSIKSGCASCRFGARYMGAGIAHHSRQSG